jgi:hypothetical protein
MSAADKGSAADKAKKYIIQTIDDSTHKSGPSYYELPYTEDDGFWHDIALQILQKANFQELKQEQKEERSKFVYTIARRVFLLIIPLDKKKLNIRYEYNASKHMLAHGDEFHVIIRIEKNKPLIFLCTRERPLNGDPCSKAKSLGHEDKDDDKDDGKTSTAPLDGIDNRPLSKVTVHQARPLTSI